MGNGIWLTIVFQMRAPFLISVSPRGDVEIALHLVDIQIPKDPAAIHIPFDLRRPREDMSPPRRSGTDNIMHMLLPKPLIMLMEAFSRNQSALAILPQLMNPIRVHPLVPVRGLHLQHVRS